MADDISIDDGKLHHRLVIKSTDPLTQEQKVQFRAMVEEVLAEHDGTIEPPPA